MGWNRGGWGGLPRYWIVWLRIESGYLDWKRRRGFSIYHFSFFIGHFGNVPFKTQQFREGTCAPRRWDKDQF